MCNLSAVCCKKNITLMTSLSFFCFFRFEEQNWTQDDKYRAITSHMTCRRESVKRSTQRRSSLFQALKTKRESFNNWTKWSCRLKREFNWLTAVCLICRFLRVREMLQSTLTQLSATNSMTKVHSSEGHQAKPNQNIGITALCFGVAFRKEHFKPAHFWGRQL